MNTRRMLELSGEEIDADVLRDAEAESRAVRTGSISRLGAAMLFIGTVAIAARLIELLRGRGWSQLWLVVPALVGAIVLIGLAYQWFTTRRRRRLFRSALNRRGYRFCIDCGYSLRGLTDDVTHCPECGAKRDSPAVE
jgi:hypothetical protein